MKDLVEERLHKMMQDNPLRIDYYERYREIIDEYNAEQNKAKSAELDHWTEKPETLDIVELEMRDVLYRELPAAMQMQMLLRTVRLRSSI